MCRLVFRWRQPRPGPDSYAFSATDPVDFRAQALQALAAFEPHPRYWLQLQVPTLIRRGPQHVVGQWAPVGEPWPVVPSHVEERLALLFPELWEQARHLISNA